MKKAFREMMRMAEEEGVEHAYVEGHKPHDRLCGEVDGMPFEIVISTTDFDAPRAHKLTRTNIRREVRRMREAALWAKAGAMLQRERVLA